MPEYTYLILVALGALVLWAVPRSLRPGKRSSTCGEDASEYKLAAAWLASCILAMWLTARELDAVNAITAPAAAILIAIWASGTLTVIGYALGRTWLKTRVWKRGN